jgi:spermidine synthase
VPPARLWLLLLAFASGAPALVYQVVWTRWVALLASSQVEAIAVVLATYFGGLALGAAQLGRVANRSARPLALYAGLEVGAGALAAASAIPLTALAASAASTPVQLAGAAVTLLPVTFLLGGTLPALLGRAAGSTGTVAGRAGELVAANTAGAVLGVCGAILAIPSLGLRASLVGAAAASCAIGLAALSAARHSPIATPRSAAPVAPTGAPIGILLVAAFAGVATLGYEVLCARLASLQLGSSLLAWGLVLGLFLLGLAAGNGLGGWWATRSRDPRAALGWIEVAAACAIALGLVALRPDVAGAAAGFTPQVVGAVITGALPPAIAMGAAFPFLVRLSVRPPSIAAAFGAVTAANTVGGIAGSLIAASLLLPWLGADGAVMVCAAINAAIGLALLGRQARARRAPLAGALALLGIAATVAAARPAAPVDPWPIFVADGAQATAVVVTTRGRRDLLVDGEPHASSGDQARRTEQLLAVLPLLLHGDPQRFLEIGLGSGITLGTAARFSLESLDCVEIANPVRAAARFFEPDNRMVTRSGAARITHGDARVLLRRSPGRYDVIAANTLHPRSLGATGLHSHEYFRRLAAALRPGGLAVQWIPVVGIDADALASILRTFFAVFAHGELWWGAENVIAVGSHAPIPALDPERAAARLAAAGLDARSLGLAQVAELPAHRIAGAAALRAVLGDAPVLTDDRPTLELGFAHRAPERPDAPFALLAEIASRELATAPSGAGMLFWLESRAARARGDTALADRREALAMAAGLAEAQRGRAIRLVADGFAALDASPHDGARTHFERALADDPEQRDARFGLAGVAVRAGDLAAAQRHLERLVARDPADAEAWNELGGIQFRLRHARAALDAFHRALDANPFYPEALANAGLVAAELGDGARAREMLARLRAVSPRGVWPGESRLAAALTAPSRP